MKGFFPHLIQKQEKTLKEWVKPDLFGLAKEFPYILGDFDIPEIEDTPIPDFKDFILFNFATNIKKENLSLTVAFFLQDFLIERVWRNPYKYVGLFRKYNGCLTPDFSTYLDMPLALQLYNVYRARWRGWFWQQNGISVIPTLQWSDRRSYCFCFEGLEKCSQVAVSTVGVGKNSEFKKLFVEGFLAAMEKIKPKEVIWYGRQIDGFDAKNYCDVKVVELEPFYFELEKRIYPDKRKGGN